MLATAVRALIAAVDRDAKAKGEGCVHVFGIMGVFWIGSYRRLKVVCESDKSLAGGDVEDLLGVPELSTSGASKIEGVWKEQSLI
jgi:hypothetical protein